MREGEGTGQGVRVTEVAAEWFLVIRKTGWDLRRIGCASGRGGEEALLLGLWRLRAGAATGHG